MLIVMKVCKEKILDMIFAEMQEISHFQRLKIRICDNAVTNTEENRILK